jgi:hypothetical protein
MPGYMRSVTRLTEALAYPSDMCALAGLAVDEIGAPDRAICVRLESPVIRLRQSWHLLLSPCPLRSRRAGDKSFCPGISQSSRSGGGEHGWNRQEEFRNT